MTSQLDLDQGGTFREWTRVYMGPSVGWIWRPTNNVLEITAAGTYIILPSVSLVQINFAGAVDIYLPTTIPPPAGAQALPGLFARNPITVVDVGGHAFANNIDIFPASVAETLMGLTSIAIAVDYGAFTLNPQPTLPGYVSISP